jgi:hypothetical protein
MGNIVMGICRRMFYPADRTEDGAAAWGTGMVIKTGRFAAGKGERIWRPEENLGISGD